MLRMLLVLKRSKDIVKALENGKISDARKQAEKAQSDVTRAQAWYKRTVDLLGPFNGPGVYANANYSQLPQKEPWISLVAIAKARGRHGLMEHLKGLADRVAAGVKKIEVASTKPNKPTIEDAFQFGLTLAEAGVEGVAISRVDHVGGMMPRTSQPPILIVPLR
jgi:hypothetical protein